jgi:hypothetical protein
MPRKEHLTRRQGALWDALAQGSPEMVADALAKPTRAASTPARQSERIDVQRPLIVYLRKHLPAGSVVFAVPNLARSREHTYTLIRDGMLPGVPDICILTSTTAMLCGDDETHSMIPWSTPWVGFIECKRPGGGVLSDAQREVQSFIRALKIPVLAECRSIPEAAQWLHEQGVVLR